MKWRIWPGRLRLLWLVVNQLVRSRKYLFSKVINLLLIMVQERIIKPSYVRGYPWFLTVEPGNICNLRCPLCPTGQRRQGLPRGTMSFENFTKIIDELAPYLIFLQLCNWGEPFLNKDIFRMIDYAHRKGIVVLVSSNLNHFDEEMAKKLIESNCDWLIVSLYGASQESCSKYQVGGNFDVVMNNILTIKKLRKKFPLIQWRFVVNKYNEAEIPKAVEMAKTMVDVLELGDMMCDTADMLFMDDQKQFENIREWLPTDEKWSFYDYKRRAKKHERHNSCSYLYS